MRRYLVWLSLLLPFAAAAQRLRVTAGEPRAIPSPLRSPQLIRTNPPLRFPPLIRAENGGLRVTFPPATPRGDYNILVRGLDLSGREASTTLRVTVKAVSIFATGKTPVILMNGWQFVCPSNPDSTVAGSQGTFGQLASLLQSDGIPVVFFNNCLYGQDVPIETLAGQLAAYISTLTYTDGTPVPEFDLVAHSMGGLIARAYLAGLQPDGAAVPPLAPKIRKLVQLAAPNFGSFDANLLSSTQTAEMTPGSRFLWNLATWNQRQDDLRGVDALAIIGNAGSEDQPNQSDGLVSLTSASLGFARPGGRTRIVPYCHVTPDALTSLVLKCSGQRGIADVDGPAHLTAQIVRSFLAGTSDWQSIGTPPGQDAYLSQFGGLDFAIASAAGPWITDLTQAFFGTTMLSNGGAKGAIFYDEFLKGTAAFQASSASAGTVSCGAFSVPAGFYTAARCKLPPAIFSVGPLQAGTDARIVPSGGTVTLAGTGFGAPCASCAVTLNPGNISLGISSWTGQAIAVTLPPVSGAVSITVSMPGGSDSITFMAAAPPSAVVVSSISNAASSAPGPIAPGELVAIKGVGLGPAAGVSFSIDEATGGVDAALAGTRVFFGTIPAPVLYASASQVNAVVPYEIAGQAQVGVQVSYLGNLSAPVPQAVAPAAPGVFTADATGSGQAAAVNADGSINSASNPVPAGSIVTVYFTGGGTTNPAGVTGAVNGSGIRLLSQPVTATVGGVPASVSYAGAAPGLVDGVLQLNLQLAKDTPSGPAQPLVISVGGRSGPPSATIAVQ